MSLRKKKRAENNLTGKPRTPLLTYLEAICFNDGVFAPLFLKVE
jgi:hypothetical protein